MLDIEDNEYEEGCKDDEDNEDEDGDDEDDDENENEDEFKDDIGRG